MMRFVRSICAAVALLASAASAFGQSSILQGGAWTPGHSPMYVGQGQSQPIVQDSGPAGGGSIGLGLSEQLLSVRSPTSTYPAAGAGTGPFGTNWCDYDAPITNSTGYHVLCLGPNSNGGGMIYYGFGGGASALPFTFNFNGTSYQFPFAVGGIVGPGTTVVNDIAVWNNTTGTLLKDVSFSAICGSNLFTSSVAGCVPASGGGTTNFLRADGTFAPIVPGGTSGQIQYNNAGALGGFTASGDATIVPSTGVVTLATVNTNVGTFAGFCLSLTANGKGLLTSILNGICGINAQTASYPIATSDCGKIVTFTGGPFTATLPAATGFSSGCSIKVCNLNANSNGQRAVLLSGFPVPLFPRLWMKQCTEVTNLGSAWQATINPGRFHPNFQIFFDIDNNGVDTNDGQVSNIAANALQHVAACLSILQGELDLSGNIQPICGPTAGQTFVEGLSIVGPFVGNAVFNITGNGGQATIQVPSGGPAVLQLNDFAPYMISININWSCVGGSSGCADIVFHQQSGADLNQSTTLTGGGAGHIGTSCDSKCKINIGANPLVVAGTFSYVNTIDQTSVLNYSSGLSLANGTTLTGGVINAAHNSSFFFFGPLTGGTGLSVAEIFTVRSGAVGCVQSNFSTTGTFTGTRQWSVLNNAFFGNISANPVPGTTAGINTASTFAAGVVANSGLNSGGC